MSDYSNTMHTTASAGTDVVHNPGPVVRANCMQTGLLNQKRALGIGCWNAQIFLDPGAQSLTARSFHQYHVDVCCLSEVRIPNSDGFSLYVTLERGTTKSESELGVDQIFTLKRILEFRHGYQQPTAVGFIDLATAFNSAHQFAYGRRLTDLDYAEDITLLAPSFGDVQSVVSQVNEIATKVGLSINTGNSINDQEKAALGINGCQPKEADSFKYLGAIMLRNKQSKDDIVSHTDVARRFFSILKKCL
ncbi:unnamed protein product [Schistocephalus solidus]|uniref:Reverse transcriptase domain-containing protein n=1 Tax=Schistocephalus solidus TaxID=70667 RepID=A0A183TRW8_SCHSO|nr:unnamed protein product [Schistocephalus solidus]